MEASGSSKRARKRSPAVPDDEACAAAGPSAAAPEPTEARSSRRTTRSVARASVAAQTAARATGPATDPVLRLPAALAQLIFLLLPAHDRMRCREVSRAWRAALADRGCWRILHFSGCKDLPRVRGHPDRLGPVILAASRAAGGAAEEVDARGLPCADEVVRSSLKQLAEENGGSLRVLRISGTSAFFDAAEGHSGESAASWVDCGKLPHLEALEADVTAYSVSEARRLLDDARQPDGRFKALRIGSLIIEADGVSVHGVYDSPEKQREVAESLAELLRTALPGHPSLSGLQLMQMPLLHPGLIDAVVDTAVACGLDSLALMGPHIDHTCLPALSRLLRCGRLRSLALYDCGWSISSGNAHALDGPQGTRVEFCAALRGSRLESLALQGLRLWYDPDNSRALLAALTAHPTLRSILIMGYQSEAAASTAAAAEAIATLLEANAPALKSLGISVCSLHGEHLERIMGALRGNTHLEYLGCAQRNGARGVDEAFAERVVLPLVQANMTLLRALGWDSNLCGEVGEEVNRVLEAR